MLQDVVILDLLHTKGTLSLTSMVPATRKKMYYLYSHHEGTMDIYHPKGPQKAIVIPRGEAPRVTMKLF